MLLLARRRRQAPLHSWPHS